MMILRFLFTSLLLLSSLGYAVQKEDHATLTGNILKQSNKSWIALTINHEKGWHTYWKNPGDAGIPTQFKFFPDGSNKEESLNVAEWPIPKRYIEAGDILAYGYGYEHTFFVELPHKSGEIKVNWLICRELCIPGGSSVKFTVGKDQTVHFLTPQAKLSESELQNRFNALPKLVAWPKDLELYLSKNKDQGLQLHYIQKGMQPSQINPEMNLLTPFLAPPVGFRKEQLKYDGKEKALVGQMAVEWDGDLQEPPRPLPTDGKLTPPVKMRFLYQQANKEIVVIEQDVGHFSLTSANLDNYMQGLSGIDGTVAATTSKTDEKSILTYLFLAFVGGLILNLMPCVLPVISLKLFGLIKYQGSPRSVILRHNFFYTLGVLLTFLALGLTVVSIKSSGEAIGWGFQLQSPLFVMGMIVILFVLTLNMFGLFEFATPGGSILGNVKVKEGIAADLFSGVLSTVLSTPCSAPFLGTALAFAFTASNTLLLAVFSFVGLGLAFPFILTAIFPQLVSFLPKPGAWMEKLKYVLGLTLLLTVVWLTDVFFNLVDSSIWVMPLLILLTSLFFAFFARKKITKNVGIQLVFFLFPLATLIYAVKTFPLVPATKTAEVSNSAWEAWSDEKLTSLKGTPVFMDFTATWCLTCKVNKKLVLDTPEFSEMAKENGIKLLRGDWTQRDDRITRFLESHGAIAVPAYFVQKADGTIVYLGETISISKVKEAI